MKILLLLLLIGCTTYQKDLRYKLSENQYLFIKHAQKIENDELPVVIIRRCREGVCSDKSYSEGVLEWK